MRSIKLLTFAASMAVVGLTNLASAETYTFDFDTYITGDTPAGTSWATLTISDNGADNVLIRLDHNATSATGQFITDLWFNLDPFVTVTQLNPTPANKFNAFVASQNNVGSAGLNFDLNQSFKTTNAGGGASRLKPGEFATFELTGSGLDSSDFLSLSSGNGNFIAMIHLQGIDGGGSVKLGAGENFTPVPEPATMGVLGLGLAALLRRKRK